MQTVNSGWFYANFPERDGILLAARDIFEQRDLGPMPNLAEGHIRLKLSLVAIAPMAKTYLELPGNDTGADELGLHRTRLGSPSPCEYIAEIVESASPDFAAGDKVWGMGPLFRYRDVRADGADQPGGMPPMKTMPGLAPEKQLSVVTASAGITAYCAVEHHPCGRVEAPYENKTILVTSAAGAVGLIVGQLYKLKGCKVIGVEPDAVTVKLAAEFAVNEAELETALAAQGFDIVRPHTLSAREQIAAFSAASLVVGPSGAAMFNCVFCHPGTVLVDIESEPYWIHAHGCLFTSCGLRWGVFEGKTLDDDFSVTHKPYRVNIPALLDRLAGLAV